MKTQEKKFTQFLKKKKARKLQGGDMFSSAIALGTQYISNEFGIPPQIVKAFVPITKQYLSKMMAAEKKQNKKSSHKKEEDDDVKKV